MSHTEPHPASATLSDWFQGARPHTWANAFAPVIAGSGVAAFHDGFIWWKALLALVVAWALIIGVNFANDYSDGIRGTDEDRTGPLRLTGSGLVAPKKVKAAAFIAFGVAGIAGTALSVLSAWWLILIGIICVLGAWFYTGGKNPYGYRGLGEIAVFIFFGLVAVMGTQFTQTGFISWVGLAAAVGVGSMSAGVNLANNIRDIPTDREAGKITLAVRLGDNGARTLFLALVSTPFIMSIVLAFAAWPVLVALIVLPLALMAAKPIRNKATGKDLIPVIGATGRAMALWAVLTGLALAFS
ncbi:1,4-dihydroxy-2-naphthoate polyprenyltransferase [Corynebacterium crudilactis]|uniref:1,4-dihydroxy-2-naphthoate octaprenyltransferase n=1 Tax=Corynebacterium crudilactis TaxID=1652495 RepID=A0A172QR58_9CORY|nr:1,4-dihydroxy-2-naphthoate polyprenyltransferase [Corynebacterium crudilactis]ANE03164.1 1,4-dihydroxy-2-naphthoate polyprenyltransferase [Corynebacterium crudilactis]